MPIRTLLRWTVVATGLLALAMPALAQQEDNSPPEILTSELALKTVLESDRLEVNFVFVDADKVTAVTIDGDAQTFEPADTVMLTRTFVFRQPVTRVRVTARDQAGNERTVAYTVFLPGVDPNQAEAPKEDKGRWFGSYDARYEQDSNPSNDLSSPISIEGVKLTGVVPDDQQADTRFNLLASGGFTQGNLTAYAGATLIDYSKDANKPYEVLAVFLGGIYAIPRGEAAAWEIGYSYTDIYVGGNGYVQLHTIAPGYRSAAATGDGGTETVLYGADLTLKAFANSNQDSVTAYRLKWDYGSTDKEKQDSYRRRFYYGSESEGLASTEYTFLGADWDWSNRWDSGLLWDIGLGVQHRNYANDIPLSPDTPLGSKRVDVPMRVSTGLGWQLSPTLRVMGNYQYLFNLSNKSPYLRQILGIGVSGSF